MAAGAGVGANNIKDHMMRKYFPVFILFILLFPVIAHAQGDMPVEIVVTGKQPGPPLWRVKNGDNTLYIFAWLSPIPENIFWESQRVEQVIGEAQEYIPMIDVDVDVSPLVMLNPINIFRGMSLGKRLTRNANDATLEDVLPPELYARFSVLKQQYFPRNKNIEKMRPLVAGGQMVNLIQKEAGLVPAEDVGKKIRRLVRRNRDITTTEIRYELKLEGGFKDIATRMEDMMASIEWELELSCFERQLSQMEEDLAEMQYRASTWAQGYIQEFRFIPLPGDSDDDCTNLVANSSEQDTYEEILQQVRSMWLDAAEKALQSNTTTFAVLDFSQLLLEDGLLSRLKSRGYDVLEP